MKIVCDFCRAEYTLSKMPTGPVKCAVCGHVWTPHRPLPQRTFIKFLSALCALLAVGIFAFVVLFLPRGNTNADQALVINTDENSVRIVKDKDGNNRIFVSGDIINNTDDVQGLPGMIITSYGMDGNVLSREDIVSPATFLDPKTTVTFNHTLSVIPSDVKQVKVELKESK